MHAAAVFDLQTGDAANRLIFRKGNRETARGYQVVSEQVRAVAVPKEQLVRGIRTYSRSSSSARSLSCFCLPWRPKFVSILETSPCKTRVCVGNVPSGVDWSIAGGSGGCNRGAKRLPVEGSEVLDVLQLRSRAFSLQRSKS